MSNLFKYTKRVLTSVLAAAVVLTAIPTSAFGAEMPDAEPEVVEVQDDFAEATEVEEEALTVDGTSGEPEVIEEGEENRDESTLGASITIGTIPSNVKLYTVNGGVATEVTAGEKKVPSEKDYVLYAVPLVGKAFGANVATVAGAYSDADDTVHTITKDADYTITGDLAEKDVVVPASSSSDPDVVPLQSALTATSYYWNRAQMITIKSSYLTAYEGRKASPSVADVPISVTVGAVSDLEYDLPVYIYDDTETTSPTYHTFSQSTRITAPKVTYGTLSDMGIALGGAVSAADWEAYDWTGSIALLKSDLSGVEATPTFTASADQDTWTNTDKSTDADKYFFNNANYKLGLTAKTTKTGYIEAEKKCGDAKFAVILTKNTKGAVAGNKKLFAVDTDFVDFKFTDGTGAAIDDQYIEGTSFTGKKVLAKPASGNNQISAVAKPYGSPVSGITLPGTGNPTRTLPTNKANVQWKMGTEEAVDSEAYSSGWTIPTTTISTAPTADVEILAQTQETVAITLKDATTKDHLAVNYVEKNGSAVATAIDVATSTGAKITDINTGSTLKFKAHPKAGYELNKITYTKYSADGTGISVSDEELTPVDGVYTISNITGFVDINIDAEKINATLTVKKDASVGSHIELKDVKTTDEITTSGGTFAKKNEAYYFTAKEGTGYYLKGITAKAGDGASAVDVDVNYDSAKKQYWIAGVAAGPIVIKPEETAALAVTKITNADATLTVDGTAVDDGKNATVTGEAAAVLTVTPNNGATVTGVYYSTNGSILTQDAMNTALSTGPTAWKLTSDNTTYRISANDIKQIAKSNRQIYVYVTTTRDAIAGTDYASVKFYDSESTPNDITSGLTLWAADGNDSHSTALGDTANERTVVAKWLKADGTVIYTSPATSTDTQDVVKYSLAKTTGVSDTDTRIAILSDNKILPTKYNGGTAASDSDVLSVEYKVVDAVAGATTKFPATVTYKADLPITVEPLRDFYETYDFAVTTTASSLIGEKKIRIDDGTLHDTAVFEPHGKIAATATTAEINDVIGSSACKAVSTSGSVVFTTTPKMKSAEEQAEYKLNGATTTNKVTANTATISVAKKLQTINASAEVTFLDGTKTTIQDAVEVVANDYGYFAIPTITVNGTSTTLYSGNKTGTVGIETGAEGVVTGTVKYDVYHALTAVGAAKFTTYAIANAADITSAINLGLIEKVNASDITWTSLVGPTGYTKYFTVTPANSGEFSISSVAKTPSDQALTLTASAKANGCVVQLPSGVSASVKVYQKLARYNLSVNTKDAGAKTDSAYIYPTLTWNMGYSTSAVMGTLGDAGKVVGTALLDVPVSKTFTLPGAEAFTGVDPRRTLAGWKDGDGAYHKIGDEFTTKSAAATSLTAIWAYKFQDHSGAYNSSYMGKILAVNKKTGAEVASPLNIATNETVTVVAGYYPLDTSVLITGSDTGYTYSSTIETVEDTAKLELKTATIAEGKTYLGADDEGKFAGSVLTGKEKTSSSLAATLTYTEVAEDAVYTANVSTINVLDSEVWEVTAADVTVENGQTEKKNLTSLKTGKTTETLADTTLTASGLTPTFTYAPEGVATVSVTDGTKNELSIVGLKQGSTDVTMKFVSGGNVEKSVTFKVTVTKAKVDIIVKFTPQPATPSKTLTATTVAEGEAANLWICDNKVDITLKDADGSIIDPSNVTFATTTFKNGDVAAAVSGANLSSASQTWTPSGFGTATATIGVTLKGSSKVYSREVAIVSNGLVKINGPKSATDISVKGADKKENTLFKVYEGSQVDDNIVAADTIAYVPVPYDPTKGATDKYSVPLSSFTAKWINTDITEEFLGWGTTKAKINQSATTFEAYGYKGALAGQPIQLAGSDIASGADVFAYFMAEPISDLVGLPTEIRLTDENPDGNIAKTDSRKIKDGTDWEEFDIQVRPATSLGDVKVSASEIGVLDIASVGQTGTPSDYGKDTSAEVLYTKTGTPWDGTKTLTLHPTVNGTKTRRTDNFRIGKLDGKVGTAYLYFSTDVQEYDPIPVYLNGEYTNAVDGKQHYMEDGTDLKEASRVVEGDVHFYDKDGVLVENGAVYNKEAGKWVLIVSSAQYTNVGKYTTKVDGVDVTYYVDNDGFLAGGLFAGCITTGSKKDSDKKYYAFTDAETAPVLSISKFEELEGKLYFFDNNGQLKSGTGKDFTSLTSSEEGVWKGTFDYVIGTDGVVLTKDFFTLDSKKYYMNSYGQKVTYAMTVAQGTAGKYVDPETKTGFVIADDDTAEYDKKRVDASIEWTVTGGWPKSYKSGDPVPKAKYSIKYKLEGEKNYQDPFVSEEITATMDPATIELGTKQVTFKFQATEEQLNGYFSDPSGKTPLTDKGLSKTYHVNSGGTFVSGGIEITGFEEGEPFKFTGGAIKPEVHVWDNDLGTELTLGVDYSLSYKNNTKITTDSSKLPIVTVNGKNNYAGKTITRTFKIVDPREGATDLTATVKKVELGGFGSATPMYNGEPWYPESITVDGTVFQHSSGEDYTTDGTANYAFSFSGNVDAGTATVGVTGQDGKTKKKTFKINKVDLSKVPTANLEISPADTEWSVKGVTPEVTVTYTPEGGSPITLVQGQDFKVAGVYADKKNVSTGNKVKITGQGTNFSKSVTSSEDYEITAYTLSDKNILSVTAAAGMKKKAVKATVVDGYDVVINAKNYKIDVYDADDKQLGDSDTLTAGTTYKVKVTPATTNLTGEGEFEFKAGADLSKGKITLSKSLKSDGVTYTGSPIDLTEVQRGDLIVNLFTSGDIKVEVKNPTTKKYETLTYGDDFDVAYQNNVNKGTMTVYVRAKDDCEKASGVKNFKVKIKAKTMQKAQ